MQQFLPLPVFDNERHAEDLGDVSAAMLIAGVRALGFDPDLDEPIPVEAQEKISRAAAQLIEALNDIHMMKLPFPSLNELGN